MRVAFMKANQSYLKNTINDFKIYKEVFDLELTENK